MDLEFPLPADGPALARTIAALANSGGGRVFVRGDPKTVRTVLLATLRTIVPVPTGPGEVAAPRPAHQGIARPPEVSILERGENEGLEVVVTPGASLCTVDGAVLVFEDRKVRALTLAEVVRRAGSGG
jgi:hypothetical protein